MSLAPPGTYGFSAMTPHGMPPMISANLGSSKWNGKQMVLWVSKVKPTAAGVRRATKSAAKGTSKKLNNPQKRFT